MSDSEPSVGPCPEEGCYVDGSTDRGVSDVAAEIGHSDGGVDSGPAIHPICMGLCNPDDEEAEKCNSAGGSDGGGVPDAPPGDAGAQDSAPDGGPSFSASDDPAPYPQPQDSPDELPASGCQVMRSSAGDVPTAQCVPAGTGVEPATCEGSSDCAPGYACVLKEDNPGLSVCRRYCCHGTCSESDRYCAERLSRDDAMDWPNETNPLRVPVCVPTMDCNLMPSVSSPDPPCPAGKVCSIVRDDGTTACVAESDLEACGDPSAGAEPCPEGFVCSRKLEACLKLCRVEHNDCGNDICQGATSGIPDGLGVCVETER